MGHIEVQHTAVRMLYDPQFRAAIYKREADALASTGATDTELGWLTKPDPRAWDTDPYRQGRALKDLIEELPVTAALLRAVHGPEGLQKYFEHQCFHAVITERGSMAIGFAQYARAQSWSGPIQAWISAITTLEAAMAALRRRPVTGRSSTDASARIVLGPRFAVVDTPVGATEGYQTLRSQLGSSPAAWVEAVAEGRIRLRIPPAPPTGTLEACLLERAPNSDALTLEVLGSELAAVVRAATTPIEPPSLLALTMGLGTSADEAQELIDDWVRDGLLQRVATRPSSPPATGLTAS